MTDSWRLRTATIGDLDGLHRLNDQEPVYRFVFDGVAPDKAAIAATIERSSAEAGSGMWVLEQSLAAVDPAARLKFGRADQRALTRHAGCVLLRPGQTSGEAELVYLLDPAHWGRGLATRMAWTAITHAFGPMRRTCVFAGADAGNTASLAVMQRLAMRFRRQVRYPLGDGFEYEITPADAGPNPRPELLRLMTDDA